MARPALLLALALALHAAPSTAQLVGPVSRIEYGSGAEIPSNVAGAMSPKLLATLQRYVDGGPTPPATHVFVAFGVRSCGDLDAVASTLERSGADVSGTYAVGSLVCARIELSLLCAAVDEGLDDVDLVWAASTGTVSEPDAELVRPSRQVSVESGQRAHDSFEALGINAMWEQGYTGAGVRIGFIDSGYDRDHPALRGQVVAERDFVPSSFPIDSGATAEVDGLCDLGDGDDDDLANDDRGHGTWVMSVAASSGREGALTGVAPGASYYIAKHGGSIDPDCGAAYLREEWTVAAINWLADPNGDGDHADAVHIVNMSFAGPPIDPDSAGGDTPLRRAVRDAAKLGMLFVAPVGDLGPGVAQAPGAWPEVMSVGAVDDDLVVRPSSGGFEAPHVRPDVVAPDGSLLAHPGGGYVRLAGTSYSASYVTGALALLLEANPGLKRHPALAQRLLERLASGRYADGSPATSALCDACAPDDRFGRRCGRCANARYGSGVVSAASFAPGSVAELLDDVDRDGVFSREDADVTMDYRWRLDAYSPARWMPIDTLIADVSGDGTVSSLDATLRLRRLADRAEEYPVQTGERFPAAEESPGASLPIAALPEFEFPGELSAPTLRFPIGLEGHHAPVYSVDLAFHVLARVRWWSRGERGGPEFGVPYIDVPPLPPVGSPPDTAPVARLSWLGTTDGGDVFYLMIASAEPLEGALDSLARAEFYLHAADTARSEVRLQWLRDAGSNVNERPVVLKDGHIRFWSVGVSESAPPRFALSPNAPNPFNPSTTIRYSLVDAGYVMLAVFDVNGRHMRTLVDGHVEAGSHTVEWGGRDEIGRDAASGVYFCRLTTTPDKVRVRKMVLVR